jgi:hypothetical protein
VSKTVIFLQLINKREAKVYCYAFLHVLKRDTCTKHEKTKKIKLKSPTRKKCPG